MAAPGGNNNPNSRGRSQFSMTFSTIGPDGVVRTMSTSNDDAAPAAPPMMHPFFGGSMMGTPGMMPGPAGMGHDDAMFGHHFPPGFLGAPRFMRLAHPGIHATNPFAEMLQHMVMAGGGGGGGGDIDSIAARLFAQSQAQERPTAQAAIDALPEVDVTDAQVAEKATCAVCMEEFQAKTKVTRMPCAHVYHKDCLLPWLAREHRCPVCRFELETASSGEVRARAAAPETDAVDAPPLYQHHSSSSSNSAGDGALDGFDLLSHMLGVPLRAAAARRAPEPPHHEEDDMDEDGDDPEMAAAIAASLRDAEDMSAQQRARTVAAAPAAVDVAREDADMSAALLESLHALSVDELYEQCLADGIDVPAPFTRDRTFLLDRLASKLGMIPTLVTGAAAPGAPSVGAAAASSAQTFSLRHRVPAEPLSSDADAFTLKLRMPDGMSLVRRFAPDATLAAVMAFVLSTEARRQFRLSADGTPQARVRDTSTMLLGGASGSGARVFTPADWDVPLRATGFNKRAMLQVESAV